MYSTILTKLMITIKIAPWEREITTWLQVQASTPIRDYSLLITGSSNVIEDGSEGRSLSQQGAGIGTFVPQIGVFDGGGALLRFWKNATGVRVFLTGQI